MTEVQPPPQQRHATTSPTGNTHHNEHPWPPTDHDNRLTMKHDNHTPTSPASRTTRVPSTSPAAMSRNHHHKQTQLPKVRQQPNRQPHAPVLYTPTACPTDSDGLSSDPAIFNRLSGQSVRSLSESVGHDWIPRSLTLILEIQVLEALESLLFSAMTECRIIEGAEREIVK